MIGLVWGNDDLGNIPPDLSSRGRAGMDKEEILGFSGFHTGIMTDGRSVGCMALLMMGRFSLGCWATR